MVNNSRRTGGRVGDNLNVKNDIATAKAEKAMKNLKTAVGSPPDNYFIELLILY